MLWKTIWKILGLFVDGESPLKRLGTLGKSCCLGSLPCYNMDVSATCRTVDWAVGFTNGLGRSARTPFMGNGAQGSFSVITLTPESCPLTLYCPRSLSLTQVPAGPGFPCALFPPLLFLTLVHSCGLVLYGANMHYLLTLSAVSSHPNFSTVYC